MTHKIEAVSVNHNTSSYMELMLRSLFAHHPAGLDLSLTIIDNASEDETDELTAYAESKQVLIIQSGFTTETLNNSHGEILRQFVLNHPDCTHYLFLDTDVCFLADETLNVMVRELDRDPDAFGIGPRLSGDGVREIPQESRDKNPDICDARLHPCCALVKNTPLFRNVVEEIGLSCVKYLWADEEAYLDTFKLMTKVMKTHQLKHIFSSQMVHHVFCVSYGWDEKELVEIKKKRRDALLETYRGY
jgi:GT2 family glycosyltransferase